MRHSRRKVRAEARVTVDSARTKLLKPNSSGIPARLSLSYEVDGKNRANHRSSGKKGLTIGFRAEKAKRLVLPHGLKGFARFFNPENGIRENLYSNSRQRSIRVFHQHRAKTLVVMKIIPFALILLISIIPGTGKSNPIEFPPATPLRRFKRPKALPRCGRHGIRSGRKPFHLPARGCGNIPPKTRSGPSPTDCMTWASDRSKQRTLVIQKPTKSPS